MHVAIRLVDGCVEGFYTDKAEAPEPPAVPAVSGREQLYQRMCAEALGNCREYIPFIPRYPGQRITAFGREWVITDAFREELVETDLTRRALCEFCGMLGRRSTTVHIYRVVSGDLVRWVRVTDSIPGCGGYFGDCGRSSCAQARGVTSAIRRQWAAGSGKTAIWQTSAPQRGSAGTSRRLPSQRSASRSGRSSRTAGGSS